MCSFLFSERAGVLGAAGATADTAASENMYEGNRECNKDKERYYDTYRIHIKS